MKWTDIYAGPTNENEICDEIKHYLNSYRKPSKLCITIERKKIRDKEYYASIYMLVSDFKKPYPKTEKPYPKHRNDGKYP